MVPQAGPDTTTDSSETRSGADLAANPEPSINSAPNPHEAHFEAEQGWVPERLGGSLPEEIERSLPVQLPTTSDNGQRKA